MAIMKQDVCKGGRVYWNRPNTYVNEPHFVATGSAGSEDEGVLMFTANDGEAGKAIFVVLNARDFTEIARIQLPNHLPFTAHGNFIPAASEVFVV